MSAGPFRLAILISGRGSNMIAIARACLAGSIPARVAVVISDRADAAGLAGAAALGIETATVLQPQGGGGSAFEQWRLARDHGRDARGQRMPWN